jgi:subtilisin family serine protease
MSSFSTYGPTYEVDFKPTLSAPGGNILSTYPLPLGGWALESGTSMATPFVAGSAALVIQARGKSVVKGIRDLLQSTASPIASSPTDKDELQTLSLAGSGLIQVNQAVSAQTIISPSQLLLNDTTHLRPVYVSLIRNFMRRIDC